MTDDVNNMTRGDFVEKKIDAMKRAHEMERKALNERHERELKMLERRLSSPVSARTSPVKKDREKGGQMLN